MSLDFTVKEMWYLRNKMEKGKNSLSGKSHRNERWGTKSVGVRK